MEIKNVKVYHGTDNKFDKFDINKSYDGGIWFTDNLQSIKNHETGGSGNKYILTRYITLNNPATWEEYDRYSVDELINMGYDGAVLQDGGETNYIVFNIESIADDENLSEANNYIVGSTDALQQLGLETYGDLKTLINYIRLGKKGSKLLIQGKEFLIDQILGAIPGAGNAKSAFNFAKAMFKKPDTVKTKTWLDRLDIDDNMSKIVDDTVEDGFLQFFVKSLETTPDTAPLRQDFNMNTEMEEYLKKLYGERFVAGITGVNEEEGGEGQGPAFVPADKTHWESGVVRGHANPIGSEPRWQSGVVRGHANPINESQNDKLNESIVRMKNIIDY